MSEDPDEPRLEPSDGAIVHWMQPRPLTLRAGGVTATAAGAFALGAAAAVAILALMRWLDPPRRRRW